jgi:hypothetical protein
MRLGGWRRSVLISAGLLVGLVAGARDVAAQGAVFDIGDTQQLVQVRKALASGLANQVGALPNPSSGGFTYTFSPTLGVFTRTTDSFGPIFAERAETTGQGKITLTASYTRHTFDSVDGVSLRDGDLKQQVIGFFPDRRRVNILNVREEIEAEVFTLGGLYGVTDRLDVGLIVPILKVKLREQVTREAFIDCLLTGPIILDRCPIRSTGRNDKFLPGEDESTGLGDIVLRAKYEAWEWPDIWGGRIAVGGLLEVKTPTGSDGDRRALANPLIVTTTQTGQISDAQVCGVRPGAAIPGGRCSPGEPPRGTGIFRVKPLLIASGLWGGFSPHVNVGAELGETEGITNDLVFAVGADITTLASRLTIAVDVLGRHAFKTDRPKITPTGPVGEANPDQFTGSFGVKINPVGTLLVFFNLLVPLNETGVRDNLTPTFGVEWSF